MGGGARGGGWIVFFVFIEFHVIEFSSIHKFIIFPFNYHNKSKNINITGFLI